MRKMLAATALVALLPLGGCFTTNLYCWADTRRDSPWIENLCYEVSWLLFVPALAGDVVTFPIQLFAGQYPYGDAQAPEPASWRHRTGGGEDGPRGPGIPTGPRGRRER